MYYTVGEVAKKLDIAPSALRYYDKEGLLPFIERSNGGIRVFSDKDFSSLAVIECLKKTGMSIKDIKRFMDMAAKGDETIDERLELFKKQRQSVKAQIEELEETLETLEFKCWYYETSKAAGTTAYVDKMSLKDMPEKYAKTKMKMDQIMEK